MRRPIIWLVALLVAISAATAYARTGNKAGKPRGDGRATRSVSTEATGPFDDVPRGHWAYDAVSKAAESGILQRWDRRFHGNRIVNRYQMAVAVARMLDRVGALKAGGKVITAQDVANLESLTIEFADELALLNVKVSTLEETVAGLRRDVDLVKADLRGVGARAGITGSMSVRLAATGNGGPGWNFGHYQGLDLDAFGFTNLQFAPPPSATTPITRYRGAPVDGCGWTGDGHLPYAFASRVFGSVANFAVNVDREFDRKVHFHAQLNVNAEGSSEDWLGGMTPFGFIPNTPWAPVGPPWPSGRGSQFSVYDPFNGNVISSDVTVNEAYVVFDDWFTDGVNGRVGVFALPMNREVNGASRTYQWTITPSIANTKWESLRPVGLDLFKHDDRDELVFYVGFFTPHELVMGVPRSGTLLSAPTWFTNAPFGQTIPGSPFAAQFDHVSNPGNAPGLTTADLLTPFTNWGFGRFPTPLAFASMTDAPFGTSTATSYSADDLGFYGMVGTHPTNREHTGLDWHVAYFDRNGDIRAPASDHQDLTDWSAWQLAASYQWERVYAGFQYYSGRSKNYSLADFNDPTFSNRITNTTPFANVAGEDTVSRSFMAMANWQFCRRASATARYENAQDKTGLARIEADVWTLGFNWKTSDHGWLQLEWIAPNTRTTSENGLVNADDVEDDLVQLNYKMNW